MNPIFQKSTIIDFGSIRKSPRSCGIYGIENTSSGTIYIGQTLANDGFYGRWRLHRKQLLSGTHHCKHMQASFNKHGEASFQFFVIEVLPKTTALSEATALEQWHMDSAKAIGAIFNCAPAAGSVRGIKRSEITRSRMSIASRMPSRKAASALGISNYWKTISPDERLRRSELTAKTLKSKKWKDAHKEGVLRVTKTPEWKAAQKAGVLRSSSTQEWRDKTYSEAYYRATNCPEVKRKRTESHLETLALKRGVKINSAKELVASVVSDFGLDSNAAKYLQRYVHELESANAIYSKSDRSVMTSIEIESAANPNMQNSMRYWKKFQMEIGHTK